MVIKMIVDTNQIITMTEANQNFSKAVKTADKFGDALILKNNKPRYLLIDLFNEKFKNIKETDIDLIVKEIIKEYKKGE